MRNKFSRVPDFNSFVTSPGSSIKVIYSPQFSSVGNIRLVSSGNIDIQAEIDSHVHETDIALIISRLQMGDTSAVNQRPVFYGDFTQFPRTYADMLSLVHAADDAFMSLSPEIRAKYNNDKNQWFASIGSESWLSDMGISVPSSSVSVSDLDSDVSEK